MRLRTLSIYLEGAKVGELFQYGEGPAAITRLRPDDGFWRNPQAPTLSWAAATDSAAEREAFWRGYVDRPFFNGQGTGLPAFFQNMLPEGALRRHLAQVRGCAPDDDFELLAACGTDLPGAIYAYPANLGSAQVADIVTQNNDALEVSVLAQPIAEATSLSGLQPKMSLVQQGGRYVARTKDARGIHIIAKLPTVEAPLMPEVEELSLRLAKAAGVDACAARLASLAEIDTDVPFALGEERRFLAVERFDRVDGRGHVHCEDFAQVLGIPPQQKYSHPAAAYGLMARLMLQSMKLGEAAVLEFVRRLAVNELLGNYDAHVKNFGVIYRDGRTPALSPAYDIVAHAAYLPGRGHALPFATGGDGGGTARQLGPAAVRAFAAQAGLPETVVGGVVREVVRTACRLWPPMIAGSALLPVQKQRLLDHFEATPAVRSYRARSRPR